MFNLMPVSNVSLSNIFEDFWADRWPTWFSNPKDEVKNFVKADIEETDKNYIINIDVPGFEKKDIKLTIENNNLKIKAEKKVEEETKKKYLYTERSIIKNFERSFVLGENVDSSKIEAKVDKGVLEIVLPKIDKKVSKIKEIKID
jgi:HSP20 family protein